MNRAVRGMARGLIVSSIVAAAVLTACGDGGSEPEVSSPPVVHGVVRGHDGSSRVAPAAATFAPGDTVTMQVYATGTTSLTWIGVISSVDGALVRDSIAVPDDIAKSGELVVTYEIRIPVTFSGTIDLSGFARDTIGLLTEAALQNSPVSVWRDVVGTSGGSVQLPAPVTDVAIDPLGSRAYLALAGRAEVSVLDLGSMTFQTPIAVPVPPSALDINPQGKTLVVALPRVEQVPVTHALAILDLVAPSPLEVIQLPREPAEFSRGPTALRVTDRNEALVVMSIDGSGEAGYIFGYDLAARTYRGAGALGLQDRIDNDTKLTRSADGTRVLLYYGGSCCPTSGQLYDAVEDDLLPVQDGVEWFGAPLSMTRVGDRTLIKASLYGAALQPVQVYHPPGEGEGSALSETGAFAYFRVGGGFLRTRLTDGVSLERFVLPETPVRLVSLPGSVERVLALSATAAYLTHIESSGGVTAQRSIPTISAVELYQSVSR